VAEVALAINTLPEDYIGRRPRTLCLIVNEWFTVPQ